MTTFFNRRDAFETLGVQLQEKTDAARVLEEANLAGWNVRKSPAWTTDPTTGVTIPMRNRFAVLYDDPETGVPGYLGDVGARHHTVQNEEQIEFLNIFREEAGAEFSTAGTSTNFGKVFISMKLPGEIRVGGVDRVDNFITSINSHDGSMSHVLAVIPRRFTCLNMLPLAIKKHSYFVRVPHTRGAAKILRLRAKELLAGMFDYLDEFNTLAERLVQTTLTQRRFEEIIEKEFGAAKDASAAAVTRAENKIAEISRLFADASTQEGIRDTAWAGFNALTEFADHFSETRKGDADEIRAERALFSSSAKDRALALILDGVR